MKFLLVLVPVAILALIFVPIVLRSIRKGRAEREGKVMVGTVRSVQQTGTYINKQPQLRVLLDVQDAAGASGQATINQVFPLTEMLAVGQQLAVVINPKDASEAFLANGAALSRPDDRTAQVIREAAAMPERFRQDKLQVGDIVAMTPLAGGNDSYQVNVVHIGQPPSPVFCTQSFPDGRPYSVGDRVYLFTDGETPARKGYILPPDYGGGQKPQNTGNRADGVVLADELLFGGAKAMGTVLRATEVPVPANFASHGASKWELEMQVVPADGTPAFQGMLSTGVSTPEKAAILSQVGASLPVRYDPPSFVLDSIAFGFGDPTLVRQQLRQWSAEAVPQAGRPA